MAVFDIVRAWHLDLDMTRRKMFSDDERLRLWDWARPALRWILVEKTVDLMKHRLILQQARAVTASSFAHCLIQEHRLAAYNELMTYTKYWLHRMYRSAKSGPTSSSPRPRSLSSTLT